MKNILNPTLNPVSSFQDRSFYAGADKGFAAKSGRVKTFNWLNLFRSKEFTDTKSFQSSAYSTANFEAANKKGPISGKYVARDFDKTVRVKTNPVKDARESNKSSETREFTGNRPYLVKGKSQKVLDSQQEQSKSLTVDEVRDLLNTTR